MHPDGFNARPNNNVHRTLGITTRLFSIIDNRVEMRGWVVMNKTDDAENTVRSEHILLRHLMG